MLIAVTAASARPDYISASPDDLSETYGEEVAKRAFSDELTETRAAMIKASVEITPGEKCPAQPSFDLSDVYPFRAEPTDVVWIERYHVACAHTLQRSLLMLMKDGQITAVPLAPGATIADPNLQVDAANFAKTAALAQTSEECSEASVVDTEVVDKPQGAGEAWKELWTLNACGELIALDVLFTPSPQGGTDVAVTATSD
jgi:hypothetical protein